MNIQDSQFWFDEETNRVPIKVRKVVKRHTDDDDVIKTPENLFRDPQVIFIAL
jgi:hypothetical protein